MSARDHALIAELVALLARAPSSVEELELELAAPRPQLERALKFARDSGLIGQTVTGSFEFMPHQRSQN